jgi:hypothetical protein
MRRTEREKMRDWVAWIDNVRLAHGTREKSLYFEHGVMA